MILVKKKKRSEHLSIRTLMIEVWIELSREQKEGRFGVEGEAYDVDRYMSGSALHLKASGSQAESISRSAAEQGPRGVQLDLSYS